jgi:hypothetical protein
MFFLGTTCPLGMVSRAERKETVMQKFFLMINGCDSSGEFCDSLDEAKQRAQAYVDEFMEVVGKESVIIRWDDSERGSTPFNSECSYDQDESLYYYQILEVVARSDSIRKLVSRRC